jgi:hypothetical protein
MIFRLGSILVATVARSGMLQKQGGQNNPGNSYGKAL